MQLTVDERNAVESGQPVRCLIPGTNVRCVVIRDDLFEALKLPVSVVDADLMHDMYLGLSDDSPEDWKSPTDWAREVTPS